MRDERVAREDRAAQEVTNARNRRLQDRARLEAARTSGRTVPPIPAQGLTEDAEPGFLSKAADVGRDALGEYHQRTRCGGEYSGPR